MISTSETNNREQLYQIKQRWNNILSQCSCQAPYLSFESYHSTTDRSKEKILAVINLDMIAYGSDNEDIDLVTRPKYSWLAEEIRDLARLYGFDTKKVVKKGCY